MNREWKNKEVLVMQARGLPLTQRSQRLRRAGEFGFDWLRIGDNGEDKYENIIVDAIKTTGTPPTAWGNQADAFKELKNEYKKIPIAKGSPSNITEDEYFVPFLQLYTKNRHNSVTTGEKPPYEAELRVLVTIEQEIEKLEFEYDKTLFTLSSDTLSDTAACSKQQSANVSVKITCHTDTDGFNAHKEIKVWAYPKGSSSKTKAEQIAGRKLAGKLIVGKNSKTYRKTINTVLIKVKTNINGIGNTGSFKPNDKKYSRRALYQALTLSDMEDFPGELNLSNDNNFQIITNSSTTPATVTYGKFIYKRTSPTDLTHTDGGIYEDHRDPTTNKLDMFDYLRNKFFSMPNTNKYINYITVFCFEEDPYDKDMVALTTTAGQAQGIGIREKNLVLFKVRSGETLAHESLHTLGLYHTHSDVTPPAIGENNQKYIFQFQKTQNIMSYASSKKYLWQWQWKIINPNLKL